jgi:hypothetical protein
MIRTQGDGTDSPDNVVPEITHRKISRTSSNDNNNDVDRLGKQFLTKKIQASSSSIYYNPVNTESVANFPKEVTTNKKKFYLIPKLIAPKTSDMKMRNKNPRLILCEPYKVS